jgi:hypothetical protein
VVSGQWSASRTCRVTLGEIAPVTRLVRDWVGLTSGLDATEKEKFLLLPGSNPSRPVRSPSLHLLTYPDSVRFEAFTAVTMKNVFFF